MAGESRVPWSADVPISMPLPTAQEVGISMSGFCFTVGGIAHDITPEESMRLSTPDFSPTRIPNTTLYKDLDLDDEPPSSMETF